MRYLEFMTRSPSPLSSMSRIWGEQLRDRFCLFRCHVAPPILAKCVSSISGNESNVETNEERTRRKKEGRKEGGNKMRQKEGRKKRKRAPRRLKRKIFSAVGIASPRRRRGGGYSSVTWTAGEPIALFVSLLKRKYAKTPKPYSVHLPLL